MVDTQNYLMMFTYRQPVASDAAVFLITVSQNVTDPPGWREKLYQCTQRSMYVIGSPLPPQPHHSSTPSKTKKIKIKKHEEGPTEI